MSAGATVYANPVHAAPGEARQSRGWHEILRGSIQELLSMAYRGLTAALWVILGIAAGAMPAHATPTDPATSATPIDFSACIAELQQRARDQGRSDRAVEEVLASLEFQPRVVELDPRQPEFPDTLANYLAARVPTMRVTMGRTLLLRYGNLLRELQHRHGVPPQSLLAFWYWETRFGGYVGKMPTPGFSATHACTPRRGVHSGRGPAP